MVYFHTVVSFRGAVIHFQPYSGALRNTFDLFLDHICCSKHLYHKSSLHIEMNGNASNLLKLFSSKDSLKRAIITEKKNDKRNTRVDSLHFCCNYYHIY